MKNIDIINLTKQKILEKDIKKVIKKTLKLLKVENPIFNLIIVDNEYIRKINKEYRKKDVYTDVISFALEDNKKINVLPRVLGDIYISIDKANEQALEYGHSLKRELCFLTTHGLLHLLGYDHIEEEDRKKMRELEECVLNDVKRRKKS